MTKGCSVAGCDRPHNCNGLCKKHADRAYYLANSDRIKARVKEWGTANPNKRQGIANAWYDRNKEQAQASSRTWRQSNPEKQRQYTRNRRNLGRLVDPSGLLRAGHLRDLPCACCGAPGPSEVDHIIPLSWAADCEITRQALGQPWCYQPLCRTCNCRKGDSGVWCFVPTG